MHLYTTEQCKVISAFSDYYNQSEIKMLLNWADFKCSGAKMKGSFRLTEPNDPVYWKEMPTTSWWPSGGNCWYRMWRATPIDIHTLQASGCWTNHPKQKHAWTWAYTQKLQVHWLYNVTKRTKNHHEPQFPYNSREHCSKIDRELWVILFFMLHFLINQCTVISGL